MQHMPVAAVQIITKPGVPAAPAYLECEEAAETSIMLTWPAPLHNGGLRIVAYEISLARPRSPDLGAPCGPAAAAAVQAEDDVYDWQYFSKVCTTALGRVICFGRFGVAIMWLMAMRCGACVRWGVNAVESAVEGGGRVRRR